MDKTKAPIAVSIDNGSRKDGPATDQAESTQQSESQNTAIKGRINKYTSGYWALALPALSVRYAFEAGSNLVSSMGQSRKLSANFLQKVDMAYAVGVGSFMMGVTALYSYRTYQDMRNLFAEPLAWEFNKKPEDVGLRDLLKSQNVLVRGAFHKYVDYNTRRFFVNSVFFSSFLPPKIAPTPDAAVKLGVASNALYLMTDVFNRKETFFERLQILIDTKINHLDKVGDKITTIDLMNLHYLRERELDPQFKPPKMNTVEWRNDEAFFGRMAELMNQTYGNTENKEHANFTISKYLYLFGMALAHSGDRKTDLAYVELANREGIPAVRKAVVEKTPICLDSQNALSLAEAARKKNAAPDSEKTLLPPAATQPFQMSIRNEYDKKGTKKEMPGGTFTEKLATESHNNSPDPVTGLR